MNCTHLNKGLAQNDQNCGICSGKQGGKPSETQVNTQHSSQSPPPHGTQEGSGSAWAGHGGGRWGTSTTEPGTLLILLPLHQPECSLNEITSHGRFGWQFFKLLPCSFQKANEL